MKNYIDENNINNINNVVNSLSIFNSLLPDKKIKMMIYLYSNYSKKSIDLYKHISEECKKNYYLLNIDNSIIRNKILKSSTIKITSVPSVIIIDENNNVTTYENGDVIDLVNNINNVVKKDEDIGETKIDNIIGNINNIEDDNNIIENIEEEDNSIGASISSRISHNIKRDDDIVRNERETRKKIRTSSRIKDNINLDDEQPEIGYNGRQLIINKYEGHEDMGESSVAGSLSHQKKKKHVTFDNVSIDDILDDINDENEVEIEKEKKLRMKDKKKVNKESINEMMRERENMLDDKV